MDQESCLTLPKIKEMQRICISLMNNNIEHMGILMWKLFPDLPITII